MAASVSDEMILVSLWGLVGVQLIGGLGKLFGVGGSKHLLPAKQGEPLLGVELPEELEKGCGLCWPFFGGGVHPLLFLWCFAFAGVTMVEVFSAFLHI